MVFEFSTLGLFHNEEYDRAWPTPWYLQFVVVFGMKNTINIIANIVLVSKILEKEKPSLVSTACDLHWFDKTCLLTSKKSGIKTLTIQHGMVNDSPIQESTVADTIAIFGNSSKKIYCKRGVDNEKLVITGRPVWDKLFNYKTSRSQKDITSELGINDIKRITVNMEDYLHRKLKIQAATDSTTINDVVNEAIKMYLQDKCKNI